MKRRALVGSLVAGFLILALLIVPPFLLPEPVYDAIYGWRYPQRWQAGDAVVEDSGPRRARNRYTINLADLRDPQVTQAQLKIAALPETQLILGFELIMASTDRPIYRTRPISSVAHLRVTNEKGEVVIDHQGPLDDWTWSGARGEERRSFIYAAGEVREIDIGPGAVRREPVLVQPDGGWGTYFLPREDALYTITLDLQPRDPRHKIQEFRLVAYGGGWK